MPNYKEKIAEFENNFSTVIDKSVRDLSMAFDNLYLDKNAKEIPPTIKLAEALLSGEHNISTKMQIHYDIANAYHDLRMIEGVYSERYLEKELYHLRCALDMYETNYYDADSDSAEVKVAQYIAMRSYTNLGNAYRALGRHIVAIDCFQDALLISNDFAMASLNLSFLLFRCAPLQIKRYEQSYYHHACYYYYKQTERCKINLEDQDYLEGLKSNISLFDSAYVENYLNKPLELPLFEVDNQDEADYRNYLLLFRLFLDPCLEILSDHCFAVDSINLPFEAPYSDREKEFIGLFNQIKQEYNWARLLWYKTSTEEANEHYSDRELDLVDTGDSSDHSLRESMLRTAFKAAYSLFDRIGFFINQYGGVIMGAINPYREFVASISPTEFEELCLEILKGYAEAEHLSDFSIQHNVSIPADDGTYQIDVYARFIAMGVEFKVIAECKRYSSPVSREKVAVLADKVKSLGAHKGIMISTCGFQSGAYEYAKKHGIALLQVINRNVMHIMNAATPETEEQKQKLHLMLDWYNRMPKYYAKEYATMDFPDKTIYPSPKMLEAIRREFVLAHKDILPR